MRNSCFRLAKVLLEKPGPVRYRELFRIAIFWTQNDITKAVSNSKDILELEQFLNLTRAFLSVLLQHWLSAGAVFGSVMLLTALQTLSQEHVYNATGKLRFERIIGTSSLTGGGAEKLGRLDILAPESDPLLTEAEVIRSRTVAEWAIAALNQTDSRHSTLAKDERFCNPKLPYPISPMPDLTLTPRQIGMRSGELPSDEQADWLTPQSNLRPEVFLSQLQVRRIPGTDIMQISYRTPAGIYLRCSKPLDHESHKTKIHVGSGIL